MSRENDWERVLPGAVAHCELREIGTRGSPSDEDRINLSADLVHMLTRWEAGDPL